MGQNSSKVPVPFLKENIRDFKIVLIGEPCVGKSSILLRYSKNQFKEDYLATKRAVVENTVKKVNLPGQTIHSITLWDLPGREDIDLRESYYRNVDAAIVVVDMTDPESIDLAPVWKQDFMNKVSKTRVIKEVLQNGVETSTMEYLPCDKKSIPVLLLGNKYDVIEKQMEEEQLQRSLELAKKQTARQAEIDNTSEDMKTTDDEDEEEEIPQLDTHLIHQIEGNVNQDPSEGDGAGGITAFVSPKGPKHNENKPDCVKHLEKIEDDHGFVGSIMVSAMDPDGSVHAAVESLVRYLLDNSLPSRLKRLTVPKEKQKFNPVPTEPQLFAETGIAEIDDFFSRCEQPMKRARDYSDYYEIVLQKFKQTCADNGYLTEQQASLEDAIIGLRDALKNSTGLELLARDKDNFLILEHPTDQRVKIPKEIPLTITQFNNEFAALCVAIINDCPLMDQVLTSMETNTADACSQLEDKLVGPQLDDIEVISQKCDKNRAKILFARNLNNDCIKKVQAAKEKVKTALMW